MADKEGEKDKAGNGGVSVTPTTDQEQDIAQTALTDFYKDNFTSCEANLVKLEGTLKHEYKLRYNLAVVEYYLSGLKNTDQFLKNLNSVRPYPCYNNDECVGLDDVERCALYYSHAVILFHQRRYNLSLNIIKQVFAFIEPMEESLAHKVCLLLLELLLCLRRVEEAFEYIGYITTQFASTKNIEVLEEPAEKKPVVFDAATDAFRKKLHHYKARCYLLSGNPKKAEKELKALEAIDKTKDSQFLSLSAQAEYLKGNTEKAKEDLLKANELDKRQFPECGYNVVQILNNNLACIHYSDGKYNLAAYHFRQALVEVEKIQKKYPLPNRPIFGLGGNTTVQLLYNIGVSQLFSKRPGTAFDFLLQAVQMFHLNPRLWLRMAECCIMTHREGNEEEFVMFGRRRNLVAAVVSNGPHRKVLLANLSNTPKSGGAGEQSAAIPAPTLEFASLCLKNALLLLPPGVEGERKDVYVSPPATPTPKKDRKPGARCSMFGAPSNLISDSEVQAVRVSALAASAYVALCLGDYTPCLEYAETLLREPRVPGAHRTLAHLYAAESLLMLDRVNDALEHLNPDHVLDLEIALHPPGVDPPEQTTHTKREWYPEKALTGKIVMQFNMAAAFAIRGELDKAGELLKHIWSVKANTDIPLNIVMLALYIEIKLGHIDNARSILKQNCPVLR